MGEIRRCAKKGWQGEVMSLIELLMGIVAKIIYWWRDLK